MKHFDFIDELSLSFVYRVSEDSSERDSNQALDPYGLGRFHQLLLHILIHNDLQH